MKQPGTLVRLVAIAAMSGVLLAACSRDDPGKLLSSARDYQAKGDHAAAIIQLKNVLQKQPENGEARLMLGQSSLLVGDALSAEKEFRRALDYGQSPSTVVPLIGAAMLQAGEAEKFIAEFGAKTLDDKKADAELRARLGEAYLSTRDVKKGEEAFAAALQADPSNVRAQLGEARLLANRGELAQAATKVEKIAAAGPDPSEALLLLSEIKLAQRDVAGARAALQRAVEAAPWSPGPRLQLISLLIGDSQFDAATAQIAAARSARAPELPLQHFEALIAFGNKDLAKGRELSQAVLKRAPSHVPSLILLGSIEFQEKHFAQAQTQLQSAVSLAPNHLGARALLARTYLASGQPLRAVDVLKPVIDSGAALDSSILMLAGEAHFASGEMKQAAALFEAASKSSKPQPLVQTRLAQIAVASGDVAGGVRKLETIAAEEGAPGQADMALLSGYVRQGETGKALEVARGMVKKRPNDPTAHQALGSVLAIRKEYPAARAAFGKALELNPTYMPAAAALAQLDIQDNKPADARGRFEAVLAKDPKNEQALLGLAEMMARMKAPSKEIVEVLQRAIAAKPDSAIARQALVNLYLRDRDTRAALTAAQEAVAVLPADPRVLDALGRAQLAAGETNQAMDTFNRLAAAEPKSIAPLMRLASIHSGRKEPEKAVEVLLRAQKIAPADAGVARELVGAYVSMGKSDLALKQAKALQAAAPKSSAGFVLEGDVHAQGKQWTAAEKAFRDALKLEPGSAVVALKIHSVLLASAKASEADAFARKWIADHPKDAAFRGYLAERALRARDLKVAVGHYEAVVALQPNNAVALNNLAWSLGQLGDARAMGFAERALQIAPDSPAVLDTAGMLLSAKGDPKGLGYLARAVELAPDRHEIRLNYAKALLKAGRKEDARRELTQLQGVSEDFTGKAEVAELLAK